jgi:DNA-binding winged helix-turn-helix (wHTH) protein
MSSTKLRFGDFVLNPARRELRRAGEGVALPPKVFDCIAYLAMHRERAVGRDELIASVWGRAEITDNLLDQVMLRARRALGDTGEERRVIRTVPRFGYAWVAATELVEHDVERVADSIDTRDIEPSPAARKTISRGAGIAIASVVAIVLLAGATIIYRSLPRQPIAPKTEGLALLLPVSIEGDPKFAWARLGAMDLMAERLRAAGQPMVPSDNVVAITRGFRGTEPDAKELDALVATTAVGVVLKASAQFASGYWRVRVESVYGKNPPLFEEGESQDLLEAARVAGDRAATWLGFAPPANDEIVPPRERALVGVLKQVEAAMLADQLDTARALLDTLDGEQRANPEVRFRRATIDFRGGRLDAAEDGFKALLDTASGKDDALIRARALNALGNIALRRDDYAASERRTDEVIALLGDRAPTAELGRAYMGRAISASAQYHFDAALADFAKARVVLESVGDRLGLARVDANLGILDARRDHYAEAIPMLARGAERLAAFHDLTSEMFARVAQVYAHLAQLDAAGAAALERRLGELVEREPNPQWKRYLGIAIADVLAANGRIAEAGAKIAAVIADAEAAADAPMLASANVVAARFALDAGKPADAKRLAGAVLETEWEAETPREQASAWTTLIRAELALGARDDAHASAERLRGWAEREGSAAARLHADLATAEVAAAADETASAIAAFDRALAGAEITRVPADLLAVCAAYADALIAKRDLARAGEVAARVAAFSERSYEAALLQARLYRALGQPAPLRAALSRARSLAGERVPPADLDEAAAANR